MLDANGLLAVEGLEPRASEPECLKNTTFCWRSIVNKKNISASMAGEVSLGGELLVNRLGFGAMRLTGEGIWGPPKDRKGAIEVLRRAVALDVNFIDTADSYGPQVNEELIAEALFPYPRGLVIATRGAGIVPAPISGLTMQLLLTSGKRWRGS